MMITGAVPRQPDRQGSAEPEYGIVPVPKGTTQSTYAVTDSIVMFKNSKVKQAAWKFLDYPVHQGTAGRVHQERRLSADHEAEAQTRLSPTMSG